MKVIGLIGAKGSGKSTFANIVCNNRPTAMQGALADRLKTVTAELTGFIRDDFDDPARKEKPYKARRDATGRSYYVVLTADQVANALIRFGLIPSHENVAPHVGRMLFTPRQAAQYIGTEVLRAVDPEVHCKGLILTLETAHPKPEILLVTDVRFPNELEFFSRFEGQFHPVYIANRWKEALAVGDAHESERHVMDLAKHCVKIDNNGTIEELEAKAVEFLKGLK